MRFSIPENIKSTGIYFIGDILVAATLSLFLIPFITQILGVEKFGEFIYFKSFIELGTFVFIFGTTTAYSKLFIDLTIEEKNHYLLLIILLYFLIFAISIILLYFFGESLSLYYYPVLLCCLGTSLSSIIGLKFRLEFDPKKFVVYQIITTTLLIIFSLLSPKVFDDNLFGLLLANALGYFIFIITGIFVLFKGSLKDITLKGVFIIYKKLYYFGTPIFIGYLAYFLYNKSSTYFLKSFDKFDVLAKLGISLQLGLVIYLTMGAYGKYYQPLIFINKLKAKIPQTYDYLILLFVLTFMLIFYGQDLLTIIIDRNFFSTPLENSLILISSFLIGVKLIFDSQILLAGKPSYTMYSSLIGGIIAVFSFITIDELTLLKVGVVMVISSFSMLVLSVYFSKSSKFIYLDVFLIFVFLIFISIIFNFIQEIKYFGILILLFPTIYLFKRKRKLYYII